MEYRGEPDPYTREYYDAEPTSRKPRISLIVCIVLSLLIAGALVAFSLLFDNHGDDSNTNADEAGQVDNAEAIDNDNDSSADVSDDKDNETESGDSEADSSNNPLPIPSEKVCKEVAGKWYLYSMTIEQSGESTSPELVKRYYTLYSADQLCLIVDDDGTLEMIIGTTDNKGFWNLADDGRGEAILKGEKSKMIYDGTFITLQDETGSITFSKKNLNDQ